MKDYEDEAFDDLERAQGWRKRQIADKQEQGEPVAHFGSAYVNENGVHVTTVLGPVAIPQDAKLYLEPQQRKPLPKKRIDELADEGCFLGNIYEITAEIEAAHNIKE